MTWTRVSIRAELVRVFQRYADQGVEARAASNLVADLGIDSLEVMEVIAELEDKFELRFPEDSLRRVRTVADVAATIEAKLRENGRCAGDDDDR